MTVAPLNYRIEVKADPPRAFDLFVDKIGLWWPKTHSIATTPQASVHIEPRVGGRWFERDADGAECDWGKVLVWEPPRRLVLAWQINAAFAYDPDLITEVDVGFAPREGGGTILTLEHRHLERMGTDAARVRGQLDGGWPTLLKLYAALEDKTA